MEAANVSSFIAPALLAAALLLLQSFLILPLISADPDPLQDFCVADLTKDMYLNGYPCKKAASVTTDDFVYDGLAVAPPTNNSFRGTAIFAQVDTYPGLNSIGLSFARLHLAQGGLIRPHIHPRASEIIFVLEGSIYAGFITSDNKLFAKVISKGQMMIFPRGLIHFQLNAAAEGEAQAVVALNSQYAGFQSVGESMFGSDLKDEVLQKAFFLDQKTVGHLKTVFAGVTVS